MERNLRNTYLANRTTFGPAADSLNYAQGGTPDRWGAWEQLWVASRATLYSKGPTLPNFAPPPSAWSEEFRDFDDTSITQYHGAGERDASAVWGRFYYGFTPYGINNPQNDASYTTASQGILQPLVWNISRLFQGALPFTVQPLVQDPPPWEREGLY